MQNSFAERLVRARLESGQSQRQIALRCHLFPSSYHRLEHGGRGNPSYATLVRLVEQGGLGLEHFFSAAALRAACRKLNEKRSPC